MAPLPGLVLGPSPGCGPSANNGPVEPFSHSDPWSASTPVITPVLLVVVATAMSVVGQSSGFGGYSYPKPSTTTAAPFGGYSYPKPTKPFSEGYTYTKPKCPLVLPSTVTETVVTTALVTETLPPLTSTQFETAFVTLPPVVQTETETRTVVLTHTSTDLIVSTHTEIHPTTVTSLLTTSYCQPNSYLPPPPPPPQPPANTYLPVVDLPAKEYLPQPAGGGQQPIKRATGERTELNEIGDGADGGPAAADQQPQPAINIIFVDRGPQRDGNGPADVPSADLMNWLLCKFNLTSGSCN
ncbi:mucin-2-like [Anopheles bellator]|uniref:mucin-2-like n=1 Tax=Anopheles bellator TaxID=139047 RepID=UPI0026482C5B|nr:mucin-2-like [Anopheles bellator]